MPSDPIIALRGRLQAAIAALGDVHLKDAPTFERPARVELGEYSTNAAMLLAPLLGEPPRSVAERLGEALSLEVGDGARVEVAGPGFLNFFLSNEWYRAAADGLLKSETLGASERNDSRILVEFVSANPTGPLTAAGGRHAAYGDTLARCLERAGYTVGREYYANDAGGQIARFAASIAARRRGEDPPQDGYAGEYLVELAGELQREGISDDDLEALGRSGVASLMRRIRATLERFGVAFDHFQSEQALYDSGLVDATLADLRERGYAYESQGALWLRSTDFGDDKDRVLVRSDGEPTYLASDAAYHRDKLSRPEKWTLLIDVWGADHHGHVARVKAAMAALGLDPDDFEMQIMQLVHLVEGGARAQMSKRAGEFVTLDELIDDIGVDAARFFMLQRSHDTTIDLDLDLARSRSEENPVYYVQYAHARIAGILAKAEREGRPGEEQVLERAGSPDVLATPCEPAETALVRRLLEFPDEVRIAAERRAPHRLCAYAGATARDFSAFYRDCRVVGAEPDVELARLALCGATKRTIAATLELLGISAPERM